MLVVFEGPDGAGKTLLMREFNEATNYKHVAVDRMYLSHMVYARCFRRATCKTDIDAQAVFKDFLRSMKPLIVYMTASVEVLNERIKSRGENPADGPDPIFVMDLYSSYIKATVPKECLLEIDTTSSPDLHDLTARITRKIKALKRR